MAEATKPKKLRLYKFAAEINLATETLMDFLKEKGYEIKNHMAVLSDEMIADIQEKFQKEIEKTEKHYRKISEFQKKYSDKDEKEAEAEVEEATEETAEEQEEEAEDKAEEDAEVETPAEIEVSEDDAEEKAVEEIAAKKSKPSEEKKKSEETEKTSDEEVEEEVADEVPAAEDTQESSDSEEDEVEEIQDEKSDEVEPKSFETETEKKLKEKKKGLTIVGKMDLGPKKHKKSDKKEKLEKKKKPDTDEAAAPKTQEQKTTPEDDLHGKKKKKKLKAKKKGKTEEVVEDPVKGKRKKKSKKFEVDKREVDKAIKRTMIAMDESDIGDRASLRKKKRREKAEELEKIEEEKALGGQKIKVTEYIAVNELANLMGVSVSEVIQKCIDLGLMVSINQRLDTDTITLVADEFGFEVQFEEEYKAEILEDDEDTAEELQPRPPVVTIMGHVDHGKTSLLDYIRKANVVAGESGGITQHIGAYKVSIDDNKSITFLDTPGHEAFTAMRARGAKVTDIVVLIVAADDAVMPQTVEAINHAQAAGVPIVIAINKIDKPNSNIEKIKQQLADRNILVEDWGGKYQCVEISAKKGINVDLLLEKILLEADLLELKANPDRLARGFVIESQLDKGRGIIATILNQKGTMHVGDPFIAGNYHGRIRAMFDERNNKVDEATPSSPVLVLGFEGSPQAGDAFVVVDSEREAREVALKRQQLKREQDHRQVRLLTLDEIAQQVSVGGIKELPLVVKGDVDGSVEALSDSLMKLSNKEVVVRVIHKGVGAISESDVLLAAASQAIIIGFHVRPNSNARKLSEAEHVDIRLYNVIYDAINEVKSALEGMLSPVISEELVATIEVRETFKVPKIGTVAGCYVQDGKINRNNKIRLFRDGVVIYEGELGSLKRFKDDVKEVDAGYECGLNITNFNDIKVGDIIESYKIIETKKKLDN